MQRLNSFVKWGCVALLGYIPFHAVISTWLISFVGNATAVKGIKDLAVLVLAIVAVILWARHPTKLTKRERMLVSLVAGYVLLECVIALAVSGPASQVLAGFIVNTRFLLFAAVVFYAARDGDVVWPRRMQLAVVIPFLVVVAFGFLQATVLPKDVLRHVGYGAETIKPYQTVDNDESTVRILSTLRGPNPLGAYLALVAPIALVIAVRWHKQRKLTKGYVYAAIGALVYIAVLFRTYSRSAYVGFLVAVGLLTALVLGRRFRRFIPLACAAAILLLTLVIALRNNPSVQKIILHRDPAESSAIDSDDQRVASLRAAWSAVASKPLGHGVGSAGIASTYGNQPVIIENQYLDTAYQLGIAGAMLFVGIMVLAVLLLLERRSDLFAVSVLAGFVGVAIIGLFWPVWSDETVAYVCWGMVGLVLGSSVRRGTLRTNEKAKA